MSDSQMELLRLPQAIIDSISHPREYIQGIGKDKKPYRKIYCTEDYTRQEIQAMAELKKAVADNKIKLPEKWDDSDFLKSVYVGKFDTAKSLAAIQKGVEWRASFSEDLSPQAADLLNRGVFYQLGRDKTYRPLIIINIYAIDPKKNSEAHTLEALCYLLKKVQYYMFYPGKIENWLILLDTNKMSFFKFPISILKMIIQTLSVYFNGTLERIVILNPSTSFNVVWGGASSFIDPVQREKISFLSGKKELKKLLEFVDSSQLECKFGGSRVNKENNFWPPENTMTFNGDQKVLGENEKEVVLENPKENIVEQLKDFQKIMVERISIMQERISIRNEKLGVQDNQGFGAEPEQPVSNPLEENLMETKNQQKLEKSGHMRVPSGLKISGHFRGLSSHKRIPSGLKSSGLFGALQQSKDFGRPSNLERVSVVSGYGRPSNRTIFKSARSSFDDIGTFRSFEKLDEADEEDDKQDQFMSFYTCFEEVPVDTEQTKQWQKWKKNENGEVQEIQEQTQAVDSILVDNFEEEKQQEGGEQVLNRSVLIEEDQKLDWAGEILQKHIEVELKNKIEEERVSETPRTTDATNTTAATSTTLERQLKESEEQKLLPQAKEEVVIPAATNENKEVAVVVEERKKSTSSKTGERYKTDSVLSLNGNDNEKKNKNADKDKVEGKKSFFCC